MPAKSRCCVLRLPWHFDFLLTGMHKLGMRLFDSEQILNLFTLPFSTQDASCPRSKGLTTKNICFHTYTFGEMPFLLSILQPFLKAACFHSSLNNCHHLFNPVRPAADRISWCLLLVSRYCNPRPPSSSFSPQTLKLQWLHLSHWARGWRKEAINGTEFCCILAILCVKITNSSV